MKHTKYETEYQVISITAIQYSLFVYERLCPIDLCMYSDYAIYTL